MTVIIHDFEVVTEPPPASAGGGGEAATADSAAPAPAGPTPADVRFVMEAHRRRCRRLWAH
jgi:hypothetical protein